MILGEINDPWRDNRIPSQAPWDDQSRIREAYPDKQTKRKRHLPKRAPEHQAAFRDKQGASIRLLRAHRQAVSEAK